MGNEGPIAQKIYDERLQKADKLREKGINPYGNAFTVTSSPGKICAQFQGTSADVLAQEKPGPYSIAGRIVSLRDFGKSAFCVLQDSSGTIQVNVRKDVLGEEAFALFKLIDIADFVGVTGTLFRSKTGELTLAAAQFLPLTKALHALPGKFTKGDDETSKAWVERQGLADVETRYRKRYLDLLSNPAVRQTFFRRAKLIQFIRSFLDARDFLEVETPMMHPLVTGATARPFITHHNTLDMRLYMRIAPELYLKRLLVGGIDRVYEINRSFRNEGISTQHNPEFTMLEFYQAYATYEDFMELTEKMLCEAAVHLTGSHKLHYGSECIDFHAGWPRIPMLEAIRMYVKELTDKDLTDIDKLRTLSKYKATQEGEAARIDNMNTGQLTETLFAQYVEDKLVQPTFITKFPVETSPLARQNDENPTIADRFEFFCARREIANAFSELSDPAEQQRRFRAQLVAKTQGAEETMDYDEDYIQALECGLPPAAGEGIGVDRLAMLFTNAQSIRDVIFFPLLKPLA